MNKFITAYKVAISIIFGLLGFVVNFYFSFSFPPYTATILIGLLFPMLITLTWGWRYGLLSALAGGCQSMWWLWGPSNGYTSITNLADWSILAYPDEEYRKWVLEKWNADVEKALKEGKENEYF